MAQSTDKVVNEIPWNTAMGLIRKALKGGSHAYHKKLTQKQQQEKMANILEITCRQMQEAEDQMTKVILMHKLEALQEDFVVSYWMNLAFTEVTPEERQKIARAADYDDCIASMTDSKGNETGWVKSWYVCYNITETNTICASLTPSKKWKTKYDDPLATGQTWKCPCCRGKYSADMGMITEIYIRNRLHDASRGLTELTDEELCAQGKFFYYPMQVKDWDVNDLVCLKLEQMVIEKGKNPAEMTGKMLYEMITEVLPNTHNKKLITKKVGYADSYQLHDHLANYNGKSHQLSWATLFDFEMKIDTGKKTKGKPTKQKHKPQALTAEAANHLQALAAADLKAAQRQETDPTATRPHLMANPQPGEPCKIHTTAASAATLAAAASEAAAKAAEAAARAHTT